MSHVVWFNEGDLRRLADGRSYERGLGYLDAIAKLDELPDGVIAIVHGTETYRVRLGGRPGTLTGMCSCPYGQEGAFCKHCVAVGLALLGAVPEQEPPEPPAQPNRKKASRRKADLRGYLTSVDRTELVDLLLEWAAEDPVLRRRLSLRAAATGDLDVPELRRMVDTLRSRGFVDYHGSFSFAGKASDVLDALDKLTPDHAATVGPLYRRALQHLTKASEQADDSAGVIGDAARRAVDGYANACRLAPPDPTELAQWLIDFQLDGPGWPDIDIADFAEPLGADGCSAYWAHLVRLHESTGAAIGAGRFDHRRFTIRHLREGYLKTIRGDVDALVALYAEELPEAYSYLQIGETLRGAGRLDEAIDWLRRGLRDASRPDRRIDDLLAQLYTETGQDSEVLQARWRVFTDRPDVSTHRQLLDAAERAGTLAETSDRALALLREQAVRGGYAADPLATILLATGDVDAAWAAVQEFPCSAGCLFMVAEHRGQTHPADAIPVYTRRVEAAIDRKNKSGYAEAARLIAALKNLHQRAGGDFSRYLSVVRDTHRRKAALLAELDRARL